VADRISPTKSGLAAERPSGGAQYGIYHAVGIRQPECAYAIGRLHTCPNTVALFSLVRHKNARIRSPPLFVSTVDSGNLAASLWAFKQGCLALVENLFPPVLWQGILDHVRILHQLDPGKPRPSTRL